MEAVSKESLEGMQLIPTPLRAEEEHRALGKDYVSHSDWEPEDRAASFLPDWGSQGRAMPPSSDSHPFSKAPASPLDSLSSTHLLAQAGSLGGANVHLGER